MTSMTTTQHVSSMTFFRAEDAPSLDDDGMMTYAPMEVDPRVYDEADLALLAAGQRVTVLFKSAGPDGYSLVHAKFGPGFRLPRHSHSADCLYYVTAGEAHMGSRVLTAGDGFFITSDTPYAYSAGPEGVEVLEFRASTGFDIKVRDKTLEQWRPVIDAIKANANLWPSPVS
jgi:quercetin dioxygenase-like cupin family protein